MNITAFLPLKVLLTALMMVFAVAGSAAEKVRIVVLSTADIHGRTAQFRHAVAPTVAGELSRYGSNAVYVDLGDTVQGTVEVDCRRGRGIMNLLNQSKCSIWVPGNHELEFGFNAFKRSVNEFSGTVLAANLRSPELENKVLPYKIMTVNGVRIAFIGLMLENMNNCFPVSEKRFQTLPGRAVLRKCINDVRREKAEVIILLRHSGIYGGGENLIDLLQDMPEIDMVIGAHTHIADAGSRVGRIWYVQPPPHGRGVMKAVISFDREKHQVCQIESEIIPLKAVPEKLSAYSRKVSPAAGNDSNFAAQRIRWAEKTDLAFYAVGSMKDLQELMLIAAPAVGDYYRVFDHFDPIITVKVNSGEMRAILREYVRLVRRRKQYLAVAGFSYSAPHGKLQWVNFAENKPVYTLALSAYVAAGAGGQLPETRRILKNRIDHKQAEKAAGILEILTQVPPEY